MSLHYVVVGPTGGTYHVAYRVPHTNTFSSVALFFDFAAAAKFAADLNSGEAEIVALPAGEQSIPFPGSK